MADSRIAVSQKLMVCDRTRAPSVTLPPTTAAITLGQQPEQEKQHTTAKKPSQHGNSQHCKSAAASGIQLRVDSHIPISVGVLMMKMRMAQQTPRRSTGPLLGASDPATASASISSSDAFRLCALRWLRLPLPAARLMPSASICAGVSGSCHISLLLSPLLPLAATICVWVA